MERRLAMMRTLAASVAADACAKSRSSSVPHSHYTARTALEASSSLRLPCYVGPACTLPVKAC